MILQDFDFNTIMANRWHVVRAGQLKLNARAYPSPHHLFRDCTIGGTQYPNLDTRQVQHIRAAAAFPRTASLGSLLDVPWSFIVLDRDWLMLVVSVANRNSWLNQALRSGARGLLRGHNQTVVYHWEPSAQPQPRASTVVQNQERTNHIRQQIEQGYSYRTIAAEHGVSASTVYRIAQNSN